MPSDKQLPISSNGNRKRLAKVKDPESSLNKIDPDGVVLLEDFDVIGYDPTELTPAEFERYTKSIKFFRLITIDGVSKVDAYIRTYGLVEGKPASDRKYYGIRASQAQGRNTYIHVSNIQSMQVKATFTASRYKVLETLKGLALDDGEAARDRVAASETFLKYTTPEEVQNTDTNASDIQSIIELFQTMDKVRNESISNRVGASLNELIPEAIIIEEEA